MVRPGQADSGKDLIYETKTLRALRYTFHRGGGQGDASFGHVVGFGNTEPWMTVTILGCRERGRKGVDANFSNATGRGYVAYVRGDYHDAIAIKKNTVIAWIFEVSGGLTPSAYRHLKRLARDAEKSGVDGTKYSGSWTARSFLSHHSQRLAAAAVYGEATAIAAAINKLKQRAAQRETPHA